jgi:predicted Zn-dependent protease
MLALSILLGNVGSLINVALVHSVIGYGRELEEEADRRAIERVLAAGFDPREMPRVFELLDEDPEGDRIEVKPAWSDHPRNVARAAYTRQALAAMGPRIVEAEARGNGLRVGAREFAGAVAWAAKDSIELSIEADRPRTALALARRVAARWPEDADAHYLLAKAYRALDARTPEPPASELTARAKRAKLRDYLKRTREERERARREDPALAQVLEANWARAEQAYREALRLAPAHAAALREIGLLLAEQGYLEEAGRSLADYLAAAPDAADRALVVRRLAAITAALRAEREGDAP